MSVSAGLITADTGLYLCYHFSLFEVIRRCRLGLKLIPLYFIKRKGICMKHILLDMYGVILKEAKGTSGAFWRKCSQPPIIHCIAGFITQPPRDI
jgi:hypothetical protein